MSRPFFHVSAIVAVLGALAAGGCAGSGAGRGPGIIGPLEETALVDPVDLAPGSEVDATDAQLAALEQESVMAAAVPGPDEAVLRPGLTVSVRVSVAGKDEVSQQSLRISERGTLTLPLVGEVQVNGLTLVDCIQRLTALYEEYLVNPQVAIQFEWVEGAMSPWGTVTVLGRVVSPGKVSIPATRDLTVSAAIQQAGGFAPSARDNGIVVSRANPNGTTRRFEVDLRALGRRGNLDEDIVLESGDVVFVPEQLF